MRKHLIIALCLLFSGLCQAQESKPTLDVTVVDISNKPILGVSVYLKELKVGGYTNENGNTIIEAPKGRYELIIESLGYENINQRINLNQDLQLNFKLNEQIETLDEVVVEGNLELFDPQMSVETIDYGIIKRTPAVLGESDLIQSLILLPGITDAGESTGGFNVRGGAADQNLILIDGVPIFYASHLFGLFSIFNTEIIDEVKLFKGGIPANYGGRISSVLDVQQKSPDKSKTSLRAGIGILASNAVLETPIVSDNTSLLLGARSSYAHWFLPLLDIDNKAYFYDFNAKIETKINANNRLSISSYYGRDYFNISNSFINAYGNQLIGLQWDHENDNGKKTRLNLYQSKLYYDLELDFVGFKWDSGVNTLAVQYDEEFLVGEKAKLNIGVSHNEYIFDPGSIRPNRTDSQIVENQLAKKYSSESAAYVAVEHTISKSIKANYGLRFSYFNRKKQDAWFVYDNDEPLLYDSNFRRYIEAEAIDTLNQKGEGSLKKFYNLEPRLGISIKTSENSSLKASATRIVQYLHLLSNANAPTPLDIWAPSGPFIDPQIGIQYALGYNKKAFKKALDFSVETYYKTVDNRIDYIDGAELIANDAVERIILSGISRAYGVELLLEKRRVNERFNGWIGYTWSKSEQLTTGRNNGAVEGAEVEKGINEGEWYPTPYDRRHELEISGQYKLSERINLSGNFVLRSGLPSNFPNAKFTFQNLTIPVFGGRNQDRLPAYHRLDFGLELKRKKNKNNIDRFWRFSVYNIYNRMNAFSIGFRRNAETSANEAVQTSVFGIIPSVSYNISF